MKILFASSEVTPFAKTGGLADVAGALPLELARQDVDCRVILPKYKAIDKEFTDEMRFIKHIYIKMGWRSQYCGVFVLERENVKFYFVDNEFYFGGYNLYGSISDDIERFAFFSKATLALLPEIDFRPDIIHCHDWQTGLIPVLLDAHYGRHWYYQTIKTIMTIHNLKFQGVYDKERISDIADLDKKYFSPDKLEFFGDANLLKGGLVYADYITTVSPTYAEEIKNPYFGEGLHGLLCARAGSMQGILNGIDYNEYNSRTDQFLTTTYDKRNFANKKRENKEALQRDVGLPVDGHRFMIGMVSRLTAQKGFDLLECVFDSLCQMDLQIVVLGTGEPHYENMLRNFAGKHPDKVCSLVQFHNALAHRIYASSDAFLMPSLFEPCGLSQMISMRYGTLPIVRETGGLKDTVQAFNVHTGEGTGFSFANYNAHEMLSVISYALEVYNCKTDWAPMIRHAMSTDFSWGASAKKYIDLYKWLANES